MGLFDWFKKDKYNGISKKHKKIEIFNFPKKEEIISTMDLSNCENFKQSYENGNLEQEWTIKDESKHGERKLYFNDGKLRKYEIYNNGDLIFVEEYNYIGILLKKGFYNNSKEVWNWEYFNTDGKKINKDIYNQQWFKNLPEEVTDFCDKHEDLESGVDSYYQVMEYTVCVYQNDEIVAEGRLQYELYENFWDEDCEDYEREGEGAILIIDGKIVDEDKFDEIILVTEYESGRFSDNGYASDYLDMLLDN